MSKRLELENLIFWRAAELQANVWGKNGALYASNPDEYLRALLAVYNRFFARENQRDFPQSATYLWDENYFAQHPFFGGLVPFQKLECELFFERYFAAIKNKNLTKN